MSGPLNSVVPSVKLAMSSKRMTHLSVRQQIPVNENPSQLEMWSSSDGNNPVEYKDRLKHSSSSLSRAKADDGLLNNDLNLI